MDASTGNDKTSCGLGAITGEVLEAYLNLKTILCLEVVMAYPGGDRTYTLIVDASTGTAEFEGEMGAILMQMDKNGVFHALSYASKQLIKHKNNYSPYLLEMDAVVWAMEYYQEHERTKIHCLHRSQTTRVYGNFAQKNVKQIDTRNFRF